MDDFFSDVGDWFEEAWDTTTQVLGDAWDTLEIMRGPSNTQYNAAQKNFSTAGEGGYTKYNLPKLKYSFIVEFVLSEFAKNFIRTMLPDTHNSFNIRNVTCFVKDVTLPSQSFEIDVVNQYNKPRIQTGRMEHNPVNIAFYDTADSSAYLLMDAYRKYYYGDMFLKNSNAYRNDTLSSPSAFEGIANNWGRSLYNNGDYDSQYFFKEINVYEIDNETYTCHNMFNAFIANYTPETKSHDSTGEPSLLSMTINYEGSNNLNPYGYTAIAAPTVEIAPLILSASMYGKAGFYKMFGEMDEKTLAALGSVGKIITAGTAGYDIISSVGDIISGDFNPDTIRNLGDAISRGSDAIGFGDMISDATESFGLGNILGDF